MKNIAHFLFELGMLKRTPRTGFQFLGSGTESVAEHIFRAAMIGYTLARLDGLGLVGAHVLLVDIVEVAGARLGNVVKQAHEHDPPGVDLAIELR